MSNKKTNTDKSDVFRFMALRKPDAIENVENSIIEAGSDDTSSSVLLSMLSRVRDASPAKDELDKIARKYINNDLPGATTYVTSIDKVDSRLSNLSQKFRENPLKDIIPDIEKTINEIGIDKKMLDDWKGQLNDSLTVSILLRKDQGARTHGIERAIRILHVISGVISGKINTESDIVKNLSKTIAVSRSIFPILNLEAAKKAAKEGREKELERIQIYKDQIGKLEQQREDNRKAITELKDAYQKDWELLRLAKKETTNSTTSNTSKDIPAVYNGVVQKFARWIGIAPVRKKVPASNKVLPARKTGLLPEVVDGLSDKTKAIISANNNSIKDVNIGVMISRLNDRNQTITEQLNNNPGISFLLGNNNNFNFEQGSQIFVDKIGIPGTCFQFEDSSPDNDDPITNGTGKYSALNAGDLHVVKKKLIGYEIGEIAHIENIMASETRSRKHRTLNRTEEFTSFTLAREKEESMDLETATRFELQKEINKSIQENTQKEAGLTVSGSYGPTVDFTANAGIVNEKSSTSSNRLSTSYSKDEVERSVQRIQEKVQEKRTLLTIDEVEVINKHSFENTGLEAIHINGVYRWVDKIYEAQLYNYGHREMIEVVIPEPAAFLRFVAKNKTKDGLSVSPPIEPGYCLNGIFKPLSVTTLRTDEYLTWVTLYNVQDITPPPPFIKISSIAFHIDQATTGDNTAGAISLSNSLLKVPKGYTAKKAYFTRPLSPVIARGEIAIGRNRIYFSDLGIDVAVTPSGNTKPVTFSNNDEVRLEILLDDELDTVPIALSMLPPSYFSTTIEVECQVIKEELEAWKISTFNAIMNRYEELKATYEDSFSISETFGSVNIQGKNPIENQKIIRNELKRLAISQMTGQTFDTFNAMQDRVYPEGYPQHDIDEAYLEGQYVRFVEQAFEWENMQYLFYPYFWGKKNDWPMVSQLDDTDPLFKDFLQAGYSRINIPVRPGFKDSVNTFLSIGELPWDNMNGAVVSPIDNEDDNNDPFLSISEEMKAQDGAIYSKSGGTVSHQVNDSNNIVTGQSTNFEEDDFNREINLAGEIYHIKAVDVTQQKLTLDKSLVQPLVGEVEYAIGAKAIGAPWRVTIPTSLVILQEGNGLQEITINI